MRRRGMVRGQEKKKGAAPAEPALSANPASAPAANGAAAVAVPAQRTLPLGSQPGQPGNGMPPGPRTQPTGPARREPGPPSWPTPTGPAPGPHPGAIANGHGFQGPMGSAAQPQGPLPTHPVARSPSPYSAPLTGPIPGMPMGEAPNADGPPSQPLMRAPPPQPTVRVTGPLEPSPARQAGPFPAAPPPGQSHRSPAANPAPSPPPIDPPTSPTRPPSRRPPVDVSRLSPAVAASLARLAGKTEPPITSTGSDRVNAEIDGEAGPGGGGVKAAE